jgi:1-acyl-sn-glycerol-3-phosphate acyltransferase
VAFWAGQGGFVSDLQAIGWGRYLLWLALRVVWAPAAWVVFRQRATGVDTLPREGPYLLLANHTATFDSPWLSHHLGRPVHFMASAPMFRNRVAGALLRAVGAFPKEAYVKDRASMARVAELYDHDQIIQIMPEGTRTWDGRPHPITPGTGRLVKRLGAQVVVCRIRTGHLWWPRWATWPRWVPVVLEYDPPRTWPEAATAEEITADIQAAMANACTYDFGSARTWSFRTAQGLPSFLWACPRCFEIGALEVDPRDRNQIFCRVCDLVWRVTVDHRLLPVSGEGVICTLAEAYDALRQHFGTPPVADRERFDRDGVILESPGQVVRFERGGDQSTVGSGRLRLDTRGLRLVDAGEAVWALEMDAIVALSMDVVNVLLIRTEPCIYRLEPADGITLLWENFLRPWYESVTGRSAR